MDTSIHTFNNGQKIRQKISKETEDLNSTKNQPALHNIVKTIQLQQSIHKCTSNILQDKPNFFCNTTNLKSIKKLNHRSVFSDQKRMKTEISNKKAVNLLDLGLTNDLLAMVPKA